MNTRTESIVAADDVRPGMSIDVAYEDADLMVVVKPAGMVSHPAYRHADGTLWNALVEMFAARGLSNHPRLLHRLDRQTSGLLCVPKHLDAHRSLERSLRKGDFDKQYLALVHGSPNAAGTIDAPLGRDTANTRQVCVRDDGQAARTHFRVIRRYSEWALLRVRLETGRMHQIRVHLAHSGHPLAGDAVYGKDCTAIAYVSSEAGGSQAVPAMWRLFLHADRLSFPHPASGKRVICRAPLPRELRRMLEQLRRDARMVPAQIQVPG
jgi:23S rRNA pseudouridine1911/1915/1917 synthase